MYPTLTQYALGSIAMAAEGYLLVMGLVRKLFFRFPIFYLFLGVILARDISSFLMARRAVSWHAIYNFYYGVELLIYLLGFSVIFDIYRRVFGRYPAIRKFFQLILVSCFIVLLILAMMRFPTGNQWWSMMMFEFEKNIRFAEAVLLMLILGIIGYYQVPLDRNFGGILYGLAFYNIVAVTLSQIFTHFGSAITQVWQLLWVVNYLVAEVIWVATLSTVAVPSPSTTTEVSWKYGTAVPDVIEGLARLNAQLSPWMNK